MTQERAERFVRHFGPDPENWVRDSAADHDVVVVGAGQAGLGVGFALRRAGIARTSVIDAAAPGGTGGWRTVARMRTLRTPKAWPEPEFGFPELSFRAWYEDRRGDAAYEELDRIPRLEWAEYLDWVEQALRVPVRHRTRLAGVTPHAAGLQLDLDVTAADGRVERRIETTRRLVLANGVEGTGGPYVPAALDGLPRHLYAHTGESIDFPHLAAKQVAVLGAGASSLDAAVAALEAGAAQVHLFTRRDRLLIQGPGAGGPSNIGARENFHRRSDPDRWQAKVAAARAGRSCTLASVRLATDFSGFRVHLDAPWTKAVSNGDGVQVEAADGTHQFDFLIAGTGYQYDPSTRPDLAPIAEHIALWGDRHRPPVELADDGLARWPYLAAGYQLQERRPGEAQWVTRVHVFSAAAALSFGIPVGDTQSLAVGIPRLVIAIGNELFDEDATFPPAETPPTSPAVQSDDPFRAAYAHAIWEAEAHE